MRDSSDSRSVSLSLADRGQTTQDFVVGIGIFLLAMAFVFSFVPSLLTPFDSSVGSAEQAQADRIAGEVVSELEGEDPNHLVSSLDSNYDDEEDLTKLGLRTTEGDVRIDSMNLRLESFEGDVIEPKNDWEAGDEYDDRTAASASRIVTVEGGTECDPACRLVVRVW